MNNTEKWNITEEFAGMRLDQAINKKFPDISRNTAQEMIKNGEITIGNSTVKSSQKLKTNDTVVINFRKDDLETDIQATEMNFPIVYEDNDIIVINKPFGLVVHPGAGQEKETVVSALLSHTTLSPIGAPDRPGIVHRLDKETSGIMILAKNKEAHKNLAEQFASHDLEKEYIALIQGHIVNKKGRIQVAIERDPIHRQRMKATSADNGKMAISIFEVMEYLKNSTLVKVQILTGRTHQIRVHMAFTGHPLLGDTTYGGRKFGNSEHFLHSSKLTITHPTTGKTMTFQADIPQRFKEVIEELREGGSKKL
ncbi:MAG: RluA family pseudouridine synthase [Candidatus Riflebacteria bacterium]|nr:RluA family pseudouridine synthase [Candidatus Riflebacteria bacterium]